MLRYKSDIFVITACFKFSLRYYLSCYWKSS